MTPTRFKAARQQLGLSQSDLADLLGLEGDNRDRTVRMWEAGDRAIPASAARLLTMVVEAMATYRMVLAGYGPPGAVALRRKRSKEEQAATEAVAALLRKAGIEVDLI